MQPKRSHYDHPYVFSADLHDQLSTSPETRFHAAYMFIRYLLRAVGDEYEEIESLVASQSLSRFETSSSDDEQVQPRHMEHATKTIIWDVAVGCLALSVKVFALTDVSLFELLTDSIIALQLHRDFLLPLNPVYAMDFLAISPQDIAYDDLEVRIFFCIFLLYRSLTTTISADITARHSESLRVLARSKYSTVVHGRTLVHSAQS